MKKSVSLGIAAFAVASIAGMSTFSASALNGQNNGSNTNTRNGYHRSNGSGNGQGNGRESSLASRAKVLGMTTEQLQTALETKTMSQIAVDKGITETDFHARMTEAAKAR